MAVERQIQISLAQAAKQGDTTLLIYCVGPGKRPPYGGGPNVCGHKGNMPIAKAIELWGAARSLSHLPFKCTVCGSTEV